jgi:hypothetical protein
MLPCKTFKSSAADVRFLLQQNKPNGENAMKKLLSLAAMFAVLSYASPASAALNFGGDATVRARGAFYNSAASSKDDLTYSYRLRLNAGADLGDGYFFKALVMDENNAAGGFQTLGYGNTEKYTLNLSNFIFGRNTGDCHYMLGRIPLGSVSNPIFDLTLYPTQPLENPVANINYDRVYGANYGTKVGSGMLNATFVVLDNEGGVNTAQKGDGIFNDGYALHVSYKANIGDVTVEPQALAVLTNSDVWSQATLGPVYRGVTPYTLGAIVGIPAGKAKISLGGFYTKCDDTTPDNVKYGVLANSNVDYSGYQFRIKGEYGPFMAWYDYNHTADKSVADVKYTNQFVWAQYKHVLYQSAAGSFSLQPTVRYLANAVDNGVSTTDTHRLRTELWATVTF